MSGSTTSDAPAGALRLRRTESVPADASVRHVDELSERAQQRLYGLLDADETGVPLDDRTANEFTDGEVVVFTGYYEVDRN